MNSAHSSGVRPLLEVRDVRMAEAVVTEGNLTRAAQRLHVTPSALSHHLRDLEERLGATLFLRAGRRMVPTEAGQRLGRAAQSVVTELTAAESDVARGGPASRVPLRVATECYTAYHWLPAALAEFRPRHPEVDVRIVVEATRQPLAALLDGRLDVAIVAERPPARRFRSQALFADELVVLARPGHRILSRRCVRAQDLAAETLLMYDLPTTESDLFRRLLTPQGVTPARVLRLELTEALLELAAAGEGIAVLAGWSAAPWLRQGRLEARPLHPVRLRRTWHAATLARAGAGGALAAFVEVLRRHAAPLGQQVLPA
jgi:LysR family transcriptional regulator for metE and metH